jgi:hypothetical protein
VDLSTALSASSDASAQQITALSCVSGPFCIAIAGNRSAVFDGRAFKPGPPLAATGQPPPDVFALSCSSSHFCLALTRSNTYLIWDGSRWSNEMPVPGGTGAAGPNGLECPTDGRCLLIGDDGSDGQGSVINYTNGHWATVSVNPGNNILNELACASANYCYLVGNSGDVLLFNGATWSQPIALSVSDSQGSQDQIDSVACAPGPLCIGAGNLGGGMVIDRGHGFAPLPGVPQALDAGPNDCGSATFCSIWPSGPTLSFGYFDGQRYVSANPPPDVQRSTWACTPDRVCVASVAHSDKVLTYRAPE